MTEDLKPGEKAKVSAQFGIFDKSGKPTGEERTVAKGETLPPTPEPGMTYRPVDKTKTSNAKPSKAQAPKAGTPRKGK